MSCGNGSGSPENRSPAWHHVVPKCRLEAILATVHRRRHSRRYDAHHRGRRGSARLLDKCDADTFIVGQGCSARSRGPAKRHHSRYAHSVRAASLVRADMIFGSDSSLQAIEFAREVVCVLNQTPVDAHHRGRGGSARGHIYRWTSEQSAVNSTACKHRGALLSLRQIGLHKNPANPRTSQLSPVAHVGEVWLQTIEFTLNSLPIARALFIQILPILD